MSNGTQWQEHMPALTNTQRKHSNDNSTVHNVEHVGIRIHTHKKEILSSPVIVIYV